MNRPTLARWVGDTDRFMTSYWRRKPAVFRPPGGAPSPFGLADADGALASGFLRTPYVEMARAEDPLGSEAYTTARTVHFSSHEGFADEAKIGKALADGATLLLRCIDQWHAPTGETVAALSGELGLAVEAFCFVTPAGRQGLPLHRDDADVLVVQIEGSKQWSVHEGPADGDWKPGPCTGAEPAEVLRATVRAGEVLYIPRGFAHQAVGDGGLSAHLSLTIREVGVVELFRTLQRTAFEGLKMAPRPLDDRSITDAAAELIERARGRLAELTPEQLVDLARASQRARMPAPRHVISLSDMAAANKS
ncbi:JmjC domain-containing protein [Streptomyces sp. NRRL B-24085]|uniref:JmjC domain-containing protein n=1 Tax=Streptomyces sp. NRRL B-24085 TaxID=1709476 RepID=UPI0006B308D6|nr:cupin domain-containing protein [Streptomyces sp. NRRL B-24085]